MTIQVPVALVGFLLGILDGALLAVSIFLDVLMPGSAWGFGIAGSVLAPIVFLFCWAAS